MPATVTMRVEGLRELGAKLKAMEKEMAEKIARSATGAAAALVKQAAVQKAPSLTGNLKRNIIAKRLPPSKTDLTSEHIVTVRRGKKGERSAHYASQVEFGFTRRYVSIKTTRGNWITLKNRPLATPVLQPPQPFMRPAFDENVMQAIAAMKRTLAQRIKESAGTS